MWSRGLSCLGASLLLAAAATAQAPPSTAPPNPVGAFLDEASAAPAEIFADLAFELIEHGRLNSREKIALLEDVFNRAGEAKEPLPLRYAGPEPVSDLTSTAVAAYGLKLDALSIRCRAVERMLSIDSKRAREFFESIPSLNVPRPACDSRFVADASVYLQTLAAVVRSAAFTKQEREKQIPLWMLESGARRATSSWEIVAAMKIFPAVARNDTEARLLAVALTTSLAVTDSDRAFANALTKGEMIPAVLAAIEKLRRQGIPELPMLSALRQYLARHLSAVRCKDTSAAAREAIDKFNTAVQGRVDIPALAAEDTKPASLGDEAPRQEFSNDAAYYQRLREVERLGRVEPGESLSKARLTPEWSFRALQVLAAIQDWKGAPEQDPVEVFHQKAALFWRLLDVIPAGKTFDTVLSEMIALMEDGAVLRRSPAEWLVEVRQLQIYQRVFTPEAMRALRTARIKMEGLPYESGREISEAFSASRLSALSLYGRISLLDRKQAQD